MAMTKEEFKSGYEACCRCEPYDISKSEEWKLGWIHASEAMEN